jgi:hypothetical protein
MRNSNITRDSNIMLGKIVNKLELSRWVFSLASLLFASVFCATALAAENCNCRYDPAVETLHGLQVTREVAIVTVTSTGCTEKEDFIIILQGSQPPIVTFIRLRPDVCKVAPHNIDIPFSLKEVGATLFTVANPFKPGNIR